VHAEHLPPVARGQLVERNAVEDSGITDHGVEPAETFHGQPHDCLSALRAGDRVVRCRRRAAGTFDLGDDPVRDAGIGAVPVHRAAQVVDDHRGTAPGQLQRI
jgi:hypothetical protein